MDLYFLMWSKGCPPKYFYVKIVSKLASSINNWVRNNFSNWKGQVNKKWKRLFIQGHDNLLLKKNEDFLFLCANCKTFLCPAIVDIFICVKEMWTDALNITCHWIDFCGRDLSLQQVAQEDCQLSSCGTEL